MTDYYVKFENVGEILVTEEELARDYKNSFRPKDFAIWSFRNQELQSTLNETKFMRCLVKSSVRLVPHEFVFILDVFGDPFNFSVVALGDWYNETFEVVGGNLKAQYQEHVNRMEVLKSIINALDDEIDKMKKEVNEQRSWVSMGYNPVVDDECLAECISNAKESWKGVDTKRWLRDIRGYEDE